MTRVALPNKGGLFDPTIELLASCGYTVSRSSASLTTLDPDNNIEFYFLRPGDIPVYVANGILDAGITGKDFVAEKQLEPNLLLDLNYGGSRLCAAVPVESPAQSLDDLRGIRIATSFPTLVQHALGHDDVDLVELEGAVEIAVQLGIAEAVVDVVDTGTTLRQAGLRVIEPPLFRSNAVLYSHPGRPEPDEVAILKSRIEGRLVAYNFMMVEYDVPAAILAEASKITPGLESPTVAPLQAEGWYSVKAMIRKREAHHIMDQLSKLGCKGILLTRIESARI